MRNIGMEEIPTDVSARLRAMLAQAKRHPCPTARADIVAALEHEGLPVIDFIVQFQQRFGGIEYGIPDGGLGFLLGISPKWGDDPFGVQEGNAYYFACGEHPVAQMGFYLNEEGVMFAKPAVRIPIASSIEKYLESEAVLFEMYGPSRRSCPRRRGGRSEPENSTVPTDAWTRGCRWQRSRRRATRLPRGGVRPTCASGGRSCGTMIVRPAAVMTCGSTPAA